MSYHMLAIDHWLFYIKRMVDMDADMDSPGKSLTGVGKLLAEGPFELVTHIQLFLDPVDILALRFVSVSTTHFVQKLCSECCFSRHVNIFLASLGRGLCG